MVWVCRMPRPPQRAQARTRPSQHRLQSEQKHPPCLDHFLFQTGQGPQGPPSKHSRKKLKDSPNCLRLLSSQISLLGRDDRVPRGEQGHRVTRLRVTVSKRGTREETLSVIGIPAPGPKAVFVSQSGAWHISGKKNPKSPQRFSKECTN